jgi:hypothetical protein
MNARVTVAIGALVLAACGAAERRPAEAPAAAASNPTVAEPSTPAATPPQSSQTTQTTQPVQPGYTPPPSAAPAPAQPGGGEKSITPPLSRGAALNRAARDLEGGARELDVAASDCTSACRALGSMDRAAGLLCQLAQDNDETRRCADAKERVYSARDRVKKTCGSCPSGPSVERSDPIPSR